MRLPECFTSDRSRPSNPNFGDYPKRVDSITIYNPKIDLRFPILTERFITTDNSLYKKETELKRLQNTNLELKVEVEIKFRCLNPHPVFVLHVAKIEHWTTPTPFEVTFIIFNRDHQRPDLPYGKNLFNNIYSGSKYTTSF